MDSASLAIEWVPIERVFPNPANPRHNDDAVPHVAASIRRFGWQQPLVAKLSGEIVAGHTRYKAALSLKRTTVPVVWFRGTELEALAFSVADNKTAEFATWDEPALAELLKHLRAEDALEGVGFDTSDIDELLREIEASQTSPSVVDDPGPEDPPVVATAQLGDVWLLGDRHRLMCGDSTKREDVERLMAGEKARLCASDPPYLVSYVGDRPNDSGKDWSATYREIDIKDADAFFRSTFTNILAVLGPKAAIYTWHAHKRCGLIQRIWEELGIVDHQQVVWVKPTAVFGRVYWHFQHEPAMMGWRQGDKPEHDGNHEFSSVWTIDWEGKQRIVGNEHPTQKPVEIFARPMRKHTKAGDIVYEPFSGSGSQLIAAEQEGRRCRAMEISPPFVDVAIRRWEKATGKEARLESTGQTFAEVAADRRKA